MTKNHKSSKEENPEQFLKRMGEESSEKKRDAAMKILQGSGNVRPFYATLWQSVVRRVTGRYDAKKKQFIKQANLSENRHLAIVTVFFFGAVFVSWKIEDKYDKMRARANNTKSSKERIVEQQNKQIQRMLAVNPFEPVPIEEEQRQKESYIYEKVEVEFDTRADLLEVMENEKMLFEQDDSQQ